MMPKPYVKYLGVPFKHLGRSMGGVDCYGLLILYFKDLFDVELKDYWYGPNWSKEGGNLFKENYKSMAIRVTEPKENDIILLYTNKKSKVVNHAGIMITDKTFIQAIKSGVCVSSIDTPVIKNRIEGFYRLCLV